MKKLLILLFVVLGAFSPIQGPIVVESGEKVISTGATGIELQFDRIGDGQFVTVHILLNPANTGTIQFAVGKEPDANQYTYTAGEKAIFRVYHGRQNLWYKASAANQSFVPTY